MAVGVLRRQQRFGGACDRCVERMGVHVRLAAVAGG